MTQGLALAAAAVTQPGDTVLVEQPTYIGFLHQLRMAGLQPISVPLDEDGIRLDVLDRLAAQTRPRFLYTIPTFQNPTGLCTTVEHRRQLLALAKTQVSSRRGRHLRRHRLRCPRTAGAQGARRPGS